MKEDTNRTGHGQTRVAPDAHALIKRAAELEGLGVSDFVIAAADAAAQQAIENAQVIHLSVEDQRRFAAAILDPPAPNEALRRAADRYRNLVTPLGR